MGGSKNKRFTLFIHPLDLLPDLPSDLQRFLAGRKRQVLKFLLAWGETFLDVPMLGPLKDFVSQVSLKFTRGFL